MSSATSTKPDGFHVWHFFVLLSLVTATVAVLMSGRSAPEHLVLISLAIGATGIAAIALHRTLAPLAVPESRLASEPISSRLRADLEREKALTLRSIKELEFDRSMGKLSQADFEEMAARLRTRAIALLKQLDERNAPYRALIERELASRVAKPRSGSASSAAAAIRAPGATERAVTDEPSGACGCGTRNDPDARFCKSCGTRLEAA